MKHAYLILTHSDFALLKYLVEGKLDNPNNDIFIHIDKKSQLSLPIVTKHSRLFFIKNRIDVRWGDFSMVKAELSLFKESLYHGPYSYYHLLSGFDLPIKSQDYIHQFFGAHAGQLFIGVAKCEEKELYQRAQVYIPFTKKLKSRNIFIRGIRKLSMMCQSLLHVQRTRKPIFKGSQWCSVTDDFVQYVVSSEKEIKHMFHHTFAPDEMFLQTLCMNSHFKEKLYNVDDEWEGCLRFIKWKDGTLCSIENSDIDQIKASDKIFARKFDSSSPVTYSI